MKLRSLLPISFIRFCKKRQISKGLKGVVISYEVDLKDVVISNYVNIAHHVQVSNSTIGERTSIGRYSKITYASIGKFCSISWDVTIGAISHPLHSISSHAFSYRKAFGLCKSDCILKHDIVEIENDVWIGCGVIVMPGVRIGNGAVIGAGSVVTHSVSPYEIVAGSPARHIDWRFDEDIREKLLKIQWWNFPDDLIMSHINLFSPYSDITKDLDLLNKLDCIKHEKE